MRHTLLLTLLVSTLVFTVAQDARAAGDPPRRPNLVLFIADDLSWHDCSVHGGKDVPTPNMDRLARDGLTMTHAFVASPSCAPSRGALLTGLDPFRNGAMFNHMRPSTDLKVWPAYLHELGYEVVAFGKVAHYAQATSYGFDHASHFRYHQDDCIEAAVQWLEKRTSSKPLCLMMGTNWPHVPWPMEPGADAKHLKLPPTFVDTPETRAWYAKYLAAVAKADHDLGLAYDAARKHLGDDALFVFTSDHGAQFPFGKWNCYDTGVRTPMVAVWPGRIRPGTTSDAMVNWTDLLPTYIEAAGGVPPKQGLGRGEISGQSILDVFTGKRHSHRDAVFFSHSGDGKMNRYPARAVRTRDWKYIRNLEPEWEFHSHIDKGVAVDGRTYWETWSAKAESDKAAAATVARYFRRPAEELFDIRNDPWEQRNLAADPVHAATIMAMRMRLDAWMKEQGDEGVKTEHPPEPAKPKPAKR